MSHTLCRKPKNARSKRALQAREPKEIEDPRTTIFVRGTHTGLVVNSVMKELVRSTAFSLYPNKSHQNT